MADFKEEDHTRDERGRFTAGALSTAAKEWAAKFRSYKSEAEGRADWGKGYSKKREPLNWKRDSGIREGYSERSTDFDRSTAAQRVAAGEKVRELDYENRLKYNFSGKPSDWAVKNNQERKWNDKEGRLQDKNLAKLPDKTKGPGALGKDNRRLSEKTREKMAETREVNDTLGQKNAPIDLFDIAASRLDNSFITGKYDKLKAREEESNREARNLINQTVTTYLLAHETKGTDKPSEAGGWYGHFDPVTNREVVQVDSGHFTHKNWDPEQRENELSHQYSSLVDPKITRIKDSQGNDVREKLETVRGTFKAATQSYEGEVDLAKAAEDKGYHLEGVTKPGWYYVDSLHNKEPERVPDRSASSRPYTGDPKNLPTGMRSSGFARTAEEQKARDDEETKKAHAGFYKMLSETPARFPFGIHPALQNVTFPGTKETFQEYVKKALAKFDQGNHPEDGEGNGLVARPSDSRLPAVLDKLSLKLWNKLEPQIRKDMGNDGGLNRFWTPKQVEEGSGGARYGGLILGLNQNVLTRHPRAGLAPKDGQPAVSYAAKQLRPLSEVLRETPGYHLKKVFPKRPWDDEAFAGGKEGWTPDPLTKEEAEKQGVLKKYVEGVRAKKQKS